VGLGSSSLEFCFGRYSIIRQRDIAAAMQKLEAAERAQQQATEIHFGDNPVTIDVPATAGPVN